MALVQMGISTDRIWREIFWSFGTIGFRMSIGPRKKWQGMDLILSVSFQNRNFIRVDCGRLVAQLMLNTYVRIRNITSQRNIFTPYLSFLSFDAFRQSRLRLLFFLFFFRLSPYQNIACIQKTWNFNWLTKSFYLHDLEKTGWIECSSVISIILYGVKLP